MDDNYTPTFSAKTRTAVYVMGLLVSFITFVGAGIALAVDQPVIAGILGLVGTGFGGVASGFGVGYRPTK